MKDSIDPDLNDSQYGQIPLSWIAKRGHEAVIKLLLETGKFNIDSKDNKRQTPLSLAADQGHEAVVKLLLEIDNPHRHPNSTVFSRPIRSA
jgi:ankyrin repeat protein